VSALAGETDRVSQLCRASQRSFWNAFEFAWPEAIGDDEWCTSPELISLYGTEQWDGLDDAGRRRLAFWEAVNFYSLNIAGERLLMEGLACRLYEPRLEPLTPYLHHFLDEENKHSVLFGGFCARYAGKTYPDRKVRLTAPGDPLVDDVLFFARVLLFEEIVDRYNVTMAGDDRLAGVARAINQRHHLEESRHLAFGRRVVRRLGEQARQAWTGREARFVAGELDAFLTATWREYYSTRCYHDAGVPDPWGARQQAWEAGRARRAEFSRRPLELLVEAGLPVRGMAP
jgi:P-aminobenzoate N-oxygenase AurF